jgi:hypothetical protein
MTDPAIPAAHRHDGFTPDPDPITRADNLAGRPVNLMLLGRLVSAAMDGCTGCQAALTDELVHDPTTTARLVGAACMGVADVTGGLPPSLTDAQAPDSVASVEFRKLANAGLDGRVTALLAAADAMTPAELRAAVDTAIELIVGHLTMFEIGEGVQPG